MPDSAPPAAERLEARLTRIELRLRRLRVLSMLLMLLAASAAYAAMAGPGTDLVVSRIILEDEMGRQRGLLTVTGGAPAIAFYDSTGQLRGDFGLAQDGRPSMVLLDSTGRSTYSLTERSAGGIVLRLSTPGTDSRVMLRSGAGDAAQVVLSGADSAALTLQLDSMPVVRLRDARGRERTEH